VTCYSQLAKDRHYTYRAAAGVLSVMAFHEKAGRSQGNSLCEVRSWFFFRDKVTSHAEWPLSPCFHPHSRGANRFARCMLGVLVSAGAAICLAPCGSALESGTWARPLTQSPQLGFGFCLFSSWNDFDFVFVFALFYAAAATDVRRLLCKGSYASPLTHK
jgi:hypothetical protein